MDANGLRVWQAAERAGFRPEAQRRLAFDSARRTLRLARQQAAPSLAEDATFARSMVLRPSPVRDLGGSFAWWDGAAGVLRAAGFGAGSTPIALPPDTPPGLPQPTDLAYGADEILYVARNGSVLLVDRRDRWAPARVARAGFTSDRLAPAPDGGVWVLDRTARRLARIEGVPLRIGGLRGDEAERFQPVEPNPDPPRLRILRDAKLPVGIAPHLIAASFGGRLALLAWREDAEAVVFTLESGRLQQRFALAGLRFPYALAFVGEARIAVLASDGPRPAAQAFVYDLDAPTDEQGAALPSGEIHPLLAPWHGGFCNSLAAVPDYPTAASTPNTPTGLRRLRALSGATHARTGWVMLGPFDAGHPGHIWHRLFVEAALPRGTGLRIWAYADDDGTPPLPPGQPDAPGWAPHLFGDAEVARRPQTPRAAWCAEPTEMPFAAPLLRCPAEPSRVGLFTALLQHEGRRVRRVAGRFLYLRIELMGDSLLTPEIAAIRVHGERFAWRDHYLPALFRETLAGPDARADGAATPPDFLDRFLGLFEGPLTQIEDKIIGAWRLTDPAGAPDPALPWLGRWIGIGAEPGEPAERLRQRLRAAPWTARLHGTLGGMLAALEMATGGVVVQGGRVDPARGVPRPGQLALAELEGRTLRSLVLAVGDPTVVLAGGAVTRGEIVVVEGFRLRRTFATILGADLEDEEDPLTLGLAPSGNSFVGDTLILGDAARREVQALFSAELQSTADHAAVAAFFRRLAHRVLVLVRATPRTADAARLAEVAAAAAPAHVEVNLRQASRPLMVGAASLVGVDTFLAPTPPRRRVRIGATRIGEGDLLEGQGRLDARAEGPASPAPIARADGPAEVWSGTGFLLSGARSEAAPGRSIARHIWTWT
jgi:phage tail-like protein